jgi:hypothetical protein
MISKKILAALICVALVFPVIAVVSATYASTAFIWGSTKIDGTATSQVDVGATVKIYWDPTPKDGMVNIYVTYSTTEDGSESQVPGASWTSLTPAQNSTISFVADQPGYYWLYLYGSKQTKIIAQGSIHALPESVLGSIMAVTAGLAAFGTVAVIKKRRQTSFSPF